MAGDVEGLDRIAAANAVAIARAGRRLRTDSWADYAEVRQSLTKAALRALGVG